MITKIFLVITAIIYGGLGGWALIDPISFVDEVGLTINSNLGSSEIRSVYGGIYASRSDSLMDRLHTLNTTYTSTARPIITVP